jgi:menaquinone-dependent protoporphyrinogen oxidase
LTQVNPAGRGCGVLAAMAHVLVLYATVEGQTRRIAVRIAERLQRAGHAVELGEACAGEPLALLDHFDAIVVGASVHYGHHPAHLRAQLRMQLPALARLSSAFFSVSLSAGGPGAKPDAARRYMTTFLRQVGWQPARTALFGGALQYSKYGRFKRELVRLFVRVAGGDTDMSRDHEYTDWSAVARFADAFGAALVDLAATATSFAPTARSSATADSP